jgi:DEAD/DEAH box helicase domain-containing protein
VRRAASSSEAADLLADLVAEGVRTLAFVRSPPRRGAGRDDRRRPARRGRPVLPAGGGLPRRLPARGAPRDRGGAARGELLGLAATNALELGIDVSGLDAVLLAGFPGTRAALWQQVGRAGRGGGDALAVLVARDDPLDTYLVHHPEALLGRAGRGDVFDPSNPYVLGPHLCAAAEELPLTEADLPLFGPTARARSTR